MTQDRQTQKPPAESKTDEPSRAEPIIVEQQLHCSTEELWRAITEREQMIQWFFEAIPEFKAEKGFKTSFLIDLGERQFTHLWKILEAIPQQKIVYDWRYQEYDGIGRVSFELEELTTGCLLRIINEGLESFPQEIPEFSRESGLGGWQYLLQNSLPAYLKRQQ